MTLTDLSSTVWKNIQNRKLRNLLTVIGIVVGISSLVIVVSLASGIQRTIITELTDRVASNQILVGPVFKRVFFIFEEQDEESGILDQATVERISAIPKVERVSPLVMLSEPATAQGTIVGQFLEVDAPVFGIDASIVQNDLPEGRVFEEADGVIPVVLNEGVVDLYNVGFANTPGFPRFSREGLIGQKFTMELGFSSFNQTEYEGGAIPVRAEIVAFSANVPMAGITMPLEVIRKYNQVFHPETVVEERYQQLFVYADSATDIESVSLEIEKLGLSTTSLRKTVQDINQTMQYIIAALILASSVILFVAGLNILNTLSTAVLERTKEIGIMRSVGATRSEIRLLFLSEAGVVGLFGGIMGLVVGLLLNWQLDRLILSYIPDVVYKPATLFYTSPTLIGSSLLFAMIISLIAGYVPASRAAKVDPIVALRYE